MKPSFNRRELLGLVALVWAGGEQCDTMPARFRLHGLDPAARYHVQNLDERTPVTASGKA